jgi:hypothetical protein
MFIKYICQNIFRVGLRVTFVFYSILFFGTMVIFPNVQQRMYIIFLIRGRKSMNVISLKKNKKAGEELGLQIQE